MIAACQGQKFGHDFPYPGAKCLKCGVSQALLSQQAVLRRPVLKIKPPKKTLHSKDHLLADELTKYFREPKRFAMFLGIIKRIGFSTALRLFSEVKEEKARDPKKLFMWKVAQLAPKKTPIAPSRARRGIPFRNIGVDPSISSG